MGTEGISTVNGVTKTAVEVPCSSDDARGGVPDPLYIDSSGRTAGWVPGGGGGGCVPDPLYIDSGSTVGWGCRVVGVVAFQTRCT